MRSRFGLLLGLAAAAASCDHTRQEPLALSVNEVMASNRNFPFTDENGLHLDWVELFNPNAETVHLGGYTLTDNLDSPGKFRFPVSESIPPGGFLVVFLVGDGDLPEPQAGEPQPAVELTSLHADFAINSRQETVSIFAMDGARLVDRVEVNNLATDISAGRFPDGAGDFGPMFVPTPGSPNLPIGVRPLRWKDVPRAGDLRPTEDDPELFEASVTFSVVQDAEVDGFEIPLPDVRVEVLDLEGKCELGATGEFVEVPSTLLEVMEGPENADCADGAANAPGAPPDPDDGCRRDASGNVIADVVVRTLRYEATLPPRACQETVLFRVSLEDTVSVLESPPTCFTYCGVPPPLVINEYVPKNRSTILFICENCTDRPSDDVRALDWFEVLNYGDEPIDLTDFGLSGNPENPFAWTFGRDTNFDSSMTSIDPGEHILIIADNDGGDVRRVYREVVDGVPDTTRAFYSVRFGLDATPGAGRGPDRMFLTAPTNEVIDMAVLDFSAFQNPGDPDLNVLNDRSFGRFPDPSCFSREPGIPPEGAGLDCFPPNVLQPGVVSDCPTPGAFNEPSAEGEPSCGAVSPRFADRLALFPRCPAAGEPVILRTELSIDASSGDEFDVVITVDSTAEEAPFELTRGDGVTVTRSPNQAGAVPGAVLHDIEAVVPGQPAGALTTLSLLARDRVIDREARSDPADDLEPEDAVARLDEGSRTPLTEGISFRFLSGFEAAGDTARLSEILPSNRTVVVPGFVPAEGARGFPDYLEILLPEEAEVDEVDLSGHFLTDKNGPESLDQPILEPRRWSFPDETVLRRGERLVLVFEEPDPDSSPEIVHVDAFDLDACRELVYLVAPDDLGNCILEEVSWDFSCDPDGGRPPELVAADVALGRICDRGDSFRRLAVPSPGEFNSALPPLLHGVSHISIFEEPNPCLAPGSLVQIQAFFLVDRALVDELGVQEAVSGALIEFEDGSTIEVASQMIASQPLPGSYPAFYQDVLPEACLRAENRLVCHAAARFREVLSVPDARVSRYRVVIEDACGNVLDPCGPGEFCFSLGSAEDAAPEVAINEINRFSDLPGSETDDRHWVELFNASGREVDLGGLSLSDDPATPRRARIPRGAALPAGETLLVITDGGPPLEGAGAPPHVVVNLPWAQFRDPQIGARRCREEGRLLLYDTVENGSCLVSSFPFSFPANANRCLPSSSLGRIPDGGPTIEVLEEPSPGSRNVRPPDASFIRGDADGDGRLTLTDVVRILRFLFSGPGVGSCLDALDADDDGEINLTDAVFLLEFLFSNGPAPPSPFPEPGPDPSEDELNCGGPAP